MNAPRNPSGAPHPKWVVGLCAALAAAPLSAQAPATPPASLADAVARALELHPSMAAAAAATRAAESMLSAARAEWWPELAVEGSAVRFQEPMLVAPLHGFDPTAVPDFDATLVRGTVAARYALFDGGRRGAQVDRAAAGLEAGHAAAADQRAELILRTADAYLALLSAREVVAAQERREEALDAEVSRARQLLDEGAAPRLELLRAEAERATVRAEGESARSRLELARATLARLVEVEPNLLASAVLHPPGMPPTPPPDLEPAALVGAESEMVPGATPAPAVARALSAAAAADADVEVARAARLPAIEAQVGYGLYAGARVDPVAEWQAGIQLRYPIFTGGARSSGIERARAEAARAHAEAQVVRDEVAQAADAARTAEVEARGQVAALESAVTRFAELTRVERLALDEGAGTQSDWLRAEAGLFQSRAALANARYAVLRARIRWARVAGRLDLDWIESLPEVTP